MTKSSFYPGTDYAPLDPPAEFPAPPGSGNVDAPSSFFKGGPAYSQIDLADITGPQGPPGPQGPQGPSGTGVPPGGVAGQFLTKNSAADGDASWSTTALGTFKVGTVSGNYATLAGSAAAGQAVTLSVDAGSADAAVNVHIIPKGAAGVLLYSNGALQAVASGPASTGRYIQLTGSVAGNPQVIAGGGGNVEIANLVTTGTPTAPTAAAMTNTTQIATTAFVTGATREKLTAARTYFVRTDGSDSNTGLVNNAGGAFLTIQKAIDVACALDQSIFGVTINVADGTYTGGMTLKSFVGSAVLNITGNVTTPTNCIISITSGFPIIAAGVRGSYAINGFHLKALTAGFKCVLATQQTIVTLSSIRFEGETHLSASYGAQIFVNAGTSGISTAGNFNIHAYADTKGIIQEAGQTITIVGTPAIAQAWAFILQDALFLSNGNTYSGSATGVRYTLQSMAYVFTGTSGSATYFPGNAAGSTATGAIYD